MPATQFAAYIAPPVVGAVIGYVTNHIAIKMLFRPLRKWHVLGVPVPLTPGIIPSKRGELASKIGKMVGRHLFTPAEVERTLKTERFRQELIRAIDERVADTLDRDLPPLLKLIPESLSRQVTDFCESLRWRALIALARYLRSDECARLVERVVVNEMQRIVSTPLEIMVGEKRQQELLELIDKIATRVLTSPRLQEEIGRIFDQGFDNLLDSDRPLADLLPEGSLDLVCELIEKELPPLIDRFGSMLHDPGFRARLVERGKKAINEFLDSLGGLSGLLSGFLNMESIYAKLPGILDKAGDEIANWLKEEKTQEQIAGMIRQRLEKLLETSPRELSRRLPYERVSQMRGLLRERLLVLLASANTRTLINKLARGGIERMRTENVAGIVGEAAPLERLAESVTNYLMRTLRSTSTRQLLDDFSREKLGHILTEVPLGRPSRYLSADGRRGIEEGLLEQLTIILSREVPVLIDSLNVQQIVEEKVNSLDLLEVEDLILGIMKEQFRYINLFGALLGGIIGAGNILLIRFL